MDVDKLKDVIINLKTGKYSEHDMLFCLAWGERNKEIFWPLMKEHAPDYYNEDLKSLGWSPIKAFTLIQDIKDGFPMRLSQDDIEDLTKKLSQQS